jgi:hypothetical protein
MPKKSINKLFHLENYTLSDIRLQHRAKNQKENAEGERGDAEVGILPKVLGLDSAM